ncbi:MAG: pentapeptide repeat-containing protein [Candidatus Gastranaerophilales bacterium]|nr:pentapeptide repeat-containing protein [Candidatus Gastranaerophilales bacterium]
MNIITSLGYLSSVNRSNNIIKTNSVSNQEIQTTSPTPVLIRPSAELLRVNFTGYQYPNDYKERPYSYSNDIMEGKITHDDIKPDADLSDANLREYNFVENGKTNINGINLKRAILLKAVLDKVYISDKHNRADLTDAVCKETTMNHAELSYAKALRGKFVKAEFNGADLSHTDFRGGKFDVAEFNNLTNLDNTDFRDAWLLDADFSRSNIDTAKFKGAYYNSGTKFPKEFNPERHDMIFVADDQGIRNEKVQEYFEKIKKYDKEIEES